MKLTLLSLLLVGGCVCASLAVTAAPAGDGANSSKSQKLTILDDKVKNCKKVVGLFTLYQDTLTGSMQLYIKKQQLGEEFIYQSFSLSGPTSMFLNQSMHRINLVFKI